VDETERMPSLIGGYTERISSKLKNCKGFWKPNSEPLSKPRQVCREGRILLCSKPRYVFLLKGSFLR